MIASDPVADSIERVMQSETLRASPGLRALFRYLAEKSLSGDAAHLKEYTVGTGALHKPADYDPRHDSTVRIQVGRLRQKLAEYYTNEGVRDPIVIELPKGRYEIKFNPREAPRESNSPVASAVPINEPRPSTRRAYKVPFVTTAVMILLAAWGLTSSVELWRERRQSSHFRAGWTPELETLWAPFLATERPLLISASAPLFVRVPGVGFFRDLSLNRPEDVPQSRLMQALTKTLGTQNPEVQYYYTPFDEANVTFMLGKVLATRRSNVSIVRSSDLTWEQLSDNNIVFTGAPGLFSEQLRSMPAKQDLIFDRAGGLRNLAPRLGEPALFKDEIHSGATAGIAYALVSHTPGPQGNGDVASFASAHSAGRMAAVEYFTDAATAPLLLEKLRTASGQIPRYFQVVLKVEFRNSTPVRTTYILHRELHRQEAPPK